MQEPIYLKIGSPNEWFINVYDISFIRDISKENCEKRGLKFPSCEFDVKGADSGYSIQGDTAASFVKKIKQAIKNHVASSLEDAISD